ncbi:MAG: AMP-binding protein [Humidesulfovibrio sp.]|nr:AMP-binding protein [Humidesulfovibrio sp.]
MDLPVLSGPAVATWQMAELRRTLAWLRGASPFHAARLRDIDLEALRTQADLARLPRMEAGDLAAPGLLTVSQDAVARVVSLNTSGTSGPAKRLYFSDADLLRTLDFFAVGMSTLCGPGDAVLVLLPGRREWGVADLLVRALPKLGPADGARAVLPPENWTPEILPALLHAEAVTGLIAAPTQLRRLLSLPREAFQGRIRTLLASAEPLTDALRVEIEAAWGCEVFDHWGMTETGYGGGVECAAHAGYHLREADLLLEVADWASGAPLPEGRRGEILVTTLGGRALPLVRHRTGDAGVMLPGPCACGSPLRRLGPVAGRLRADGHGIEQPNKGWVAKP